MNKWTERVIELGADATQVIPPNQVVVAEWVRLKCQYGCGEYGTCLTCPPFSPPPEVTRRLLNHYQKGLLLRVDGINGGVDEEKRLRLKLNEAVVTLERELFLAGYHGVWGMSAGPCPLCESCDVANPCVLPSRARPSMEACGIDVYRTVRQIGWEIEVIQTLESPCRLFGLVLIE